MDDRQVPCGMQLQAAAGRWSTSRGWPHAPARRRARTGPMTLYNRAADRTDLEVLVVAAVGAEVHRLHSVRDDWRDAVRDVATAMWRVVRAHPHANLLTHRRTRSPAPRRRRDAAGGAGAKRRSGRSLLIAFRAVSALIMASRRRSWLTARGGSRRAGEGGHRDGCDAAARALPRLMRSRPRLRARPSASFGSASIFIAGPPLHPDRAARRPRGFAARRARKEQRCVAPIRGTGSPEPSPHGC
jgi:hypothetical protein